MNTKHLKLISILTVIMSVPLIIVSYYGVFISDTYSRETSSMAAQGTGQDIVNLFFVTPLLLISLFFVRKGGKISYFIFGGTVSYILYSFIVYCFGVHFNNLFLLYCAILGLSIYTFILTISDLKRIFTIGLVGDKIPIRSIGYFFIIVSALFYLIWLKDIVPAIMSNAIPKSVSDYNLLVNPVHVIDISFALPGLIITAILLLKKESLGYILTPICLVFIFLMAFALAAMVIMMKINGIADDISIAVVFVVLAIISLIFLFKYLQNFK